MRLASAKGLDFLVIGAQKAGTTSVHEYLRTHPGLYLPEGKEYSFFDHEHDAYLKHDPERARELGRWGAFLADVFADAPPERQWGKVSPSYMFGAPRSVDLETARRLPDPERIVPERIRERLPEVRLIAILRDPVARARSAHRMAVMRGHESRSFDQAVPESLAPKALEDARRFPVETNSYVVLGEYGRILQPYVELFGTEQLLIAFTDELERDAAATIRAMFEHIGVDPGHAPPNLDRRYMQGASARRPRWLDLIRLRRAASASSAVRRIWERMTPNQRRIAILAMRRANYRLTFRTWRSGSREESIEPGTRLALVRHYQPDANRLEGLIGRRPPWHVGD